MASVAYNSFKSNLFNSTFASGIANAGNAVKIMLLDDLSTTPDNPDHDFVNDIAASEFAGTNYTGGFGGAGRKALANRTVTTDNTNERSEFDHDDILWTALGGAANPVVMAVIVREVTNDAASNLITCHDVADTATNGTDYTLQVGTEGSIHIT